MLVMIQFYIDKAFIKTLDLAIEEFSLILSFSYYKKNKKWCVEFLFNQNDQESCINFLQDLFNKEKKVIPSYKVIPIKEINWLNLTQQSFPSLTIGNYYVYGSHIKETIPNGKILILIEAATAFGSGQHPTTAGCLEALSQLKNNGVIVGNILDVGTGSGILAIAAALTWDCFVIAVDIDPESVSVAKTHVMLNKVDMCVVPLVSDGVSATFVQEKRPYDLIISNILARPLCKFALSFKEILVDNGVIILSGLLSSQRDEVVKAYAGQGLILQKEICLDEWSTLILSQNDLFQ